MSNTSRMSVAVCKHVARIRGNHKRHFMQSPCLMTPVEPPPLTKAIFSNGVKKIVMSSNKTRNALSLQMMEDLIYHITVNQDDPKLRCIVLYGEGRVFSAGHNLKELVGKSAENIQHIFSTCSRLMMGIIQCPVPVIAVVQGLAAAAGCQLVATCDIAVCTTDSSFSTPGANVGIFCSTPGIAVGRAVPRKIAAHMLFTGFPLTAEEALTAGLVSRVIPEENLEEEVDKIIEAICSKSRSILATGKKFFYQQLEEDIQTAYTLGEEVMTNTILLADGQEGIRSFMEKRKAVWSHNFEKAH